MDVRDAIRTRRTLKVLPTPDAAWDSPDDSVRRRIADLLELAGQAPFHKPEVIFGPNDTSKIEDTALRVWLKDESAVPKLEDALKKLGFTECTKINVVLID